MRKDVINKSNFKFLRLLAIALIGVFLSGCDFIKPEEKPEIILPTEISIQGETSGYIGDTIQLTLVVLPENATKDFTWISSNLSVATVTSSGFVTLYQKGNTTIIALCKHSGEQAAIVITVNELVEEITHTVTFMDEDTILSVIEVVTGESAIAPTPPEKEGYTFVGWDVDFSTITGDLVVQAIYQEVTQTVTVTFKIGEEVIDVQEILKGESAIAPTVPTVDGYSFVGWNSSFENVTTNLVVEAIYETIVITFLVVFMDGEIVLHSLEVQSGSQATPPTPPVKDGFIFIGWDKDLSVVTEDLTVQAIFEEIDNSILTIDTVKQEIDNRSSEALTFVGTVIGFDSMGFAHVSDHTGTIYVRAIHSLLTLGSVVKITGYGIIWEGSETFPEYTRQISNNQIQIEPYYGAVYPPRPIQQITAEDLVTDKENFTNKDFHNNLVEITGIVKTGGDRFSYYLTDDDGNHIAGIHHYSTNFRNQITDPSQNIFMNLHGQKVTLIGVIYRFYIKDDIWTIQCIGIENEVTIDEHYDFDTVRLFMINDTHGALYTDDGTPGLEKVSSLLKSLESVNGPYIKIANGDILQGAYVSNVNFGRPIIDVLNAMQFDAFVIGNHEFDWGIDKIAAYADGNVENGEANFPFLAANIVYTGTQQKLPWTQDYVIIEQGSNRIGVIGMIGYGLESSIDATQVAGYSFLNPVPIAASLSQELRLVHNCNVVIVAIHDHTQNTIRQFSQLTGNNRIDGVLCAHTHQQLAYYEYRTDGYPMPVMQGYHKNYSVSTMVIPIENNIPAMTPATLTHHNTMSYPSDSEIIDVILNYNDDITIANTVIGYTVEHLTRYRLGTEMVNAIQEQFDTDVAIVNTGGVRAEIGVGNIMIKHIYEVFPFDNTVITVNISGFDLIRLYNDNSGYLYFNNQFHVNNINSSQTYSLAVIDFIFNGSRYATYFANCTNIVHTNIYMRDVFIDYVADFYS